MADTDPLFQPGSILEETIAEIREILGGDYETITIKRVVIGIFFTGIKLSDGSCGICFTPIKEIPEAVCCPSSARAMPYPGKFTGKTLPGLFMTCPEPRRSKRPSVLPS